MRWGFRLLAGLAVLLPAGAALAAEAGPSREETLTLQQRLTDAGCYHGAIDGAPSAALDAAVKACPDQRPMLRIETGMHTATIRKVGVDAACTRLATTSDDKTVRLWSLPDGRLERTIRLPIGAGDGGKVYAAALSPDGRWLAAGGYDASAEKTNTGVNLVDLQTGVMRRFGAFEKAIDDRVFPRRTPGRGRIGSRPRASCHRQRERRRSAGGPRLRRCHLRGRIRAGWFAHRGEPRRLVAPLWAGPSADRQTRRAGRQTSLRGSDRSSGAARRGRLCGRAACLDPRRGHPCADRRSANGRFEIGRYRQRRLVERRRDADGGRIGAREVRGRVATFRSPFHARRSACRRRHSRRIQHDLGHPTLWRWFRFRRVDPTFGLLRSDGKATTLQGPRTADMRDKLGDAFALSADAAIVRFGLGTPRSEPDRLRPDRGLARRLDLTAGGVARAVDRRDADVRLAGQRRAEISRCVDRARPP